MAQDIINIYETEMASVLGTQPTQQWGVNRELDMMDTLTRPGNIMQWMRDYYPEVKTWYASIPGHKIGTVHVTFEEFVFQMWFFFHEEKVDGIFGR